MSAFAIRSAARSDGAARVHRGRTRAALFAILVVSAALAACTPPQVPATKTVSLRMKGGPANATVTVDDQLVGPFDLVQAKGVALPPGKHRVTVEASGFLPRDFMVDAKEAPVILDVSLVPIPD